MACTGSKPHASIAAVVGVVMVVEEEEEDEVLVFLAGGGAAARVFLPVLPAPVTVNRL